MGWNEFLLIFFYGFIDDIDYRFYKNDEIVEEDKRIFLDLLVGIEIFFLFLFDNEFYVITICVNIVNEK